MKPSHSLTVAYDGLVRAIESDCGISAGFDPRSPPDPVPKTERFHAIWDTGASASVISQDVVDRLGLVATGMTKVHGVSGESETETYLVNVHLPNGVGFPAVPVTKGVLGSACAVLIGMDIIRAGDFAVTNIDGKTVMSFRVPSVSCIDFVKEHAAAAAKDRALAAAGPVVQPHFRRLKKSKKGKRRR